MANKWRWIAGGVLLTGALVFFITPPANHEESMQRTDLPWQVEALPDGSSREFPAGSTVLDVAAAIGPRLARDTVAGAVDAAVIVEGAAELARRAERIARRHDLEIELLDGTIIAVEVHPTSLGGFILSPFLVFMILIGFLGNLFTDTSVQELIGYLNLMAHMDDFAKGVVDTRRLVYYLATSALFLFLAARALESRKWR